MTYILRLYIVGAISQVWQAMFLYVFGSLRMKVGCCNCYTRAISGLEYVLRKDVKASTTQSTKGFMWLQLMFREQTLALTATEKCIGGRLMKSVGILSRS